MLVLTRGKDESIVIGDGEIEVTVLSIEDGGRKIRLGIAAPRDVRIWRKEVWLSIQEENKRGAAVKPSDLPTL